jgi:TRAP-type mannitol/chloroaromatic compound transport system substrate-binding protein
VPAFWISKSPGIGFFGSFPFGMTAYERQAWMMHGGGQALYDETYARFGVKPFNTGDSGPQWMGWFRREIRTIDDFRGLRFRTAGLGGEMFRRAGASVVTLPAGEIFSAMQSGTIDAAEFLGPFSDAPLGLHQVAKNYYYPGVQEPSSAEEIGINLGRWNALPDDLKNAVPVRLPERGRGDHHRIRRPPPGGAGRTHQPPWRDGARGTAGSADRLRQLRRPDDGGVPATTRTRW